MCWLGWCLEEVQWTNLVERGQRTEGRRRRVGVGEGWVRKRWNWGNLGFLGRKLVVFLKNLVCFIHIIMCMFIYQFVIIFICLFVIININIHIITIILTLIIIFINTYILILIIIFTFIHISIIIHIEILINNKHFLQQIRGDLGFLGDFRIERAERWVLAESWLGSVLRRGALFWGRKPVTLCF